MVWRYHENRWFEDRRLRLQMFGGRGARGVGLVFCRRR
jgi:hypothetical protein